MNAPIKSHRLQNFEVNQFSSDDEDPSVSESFNRFMYEQILQLGRSLHVSAKAANMPVIDFAISAVNGQPRTASAVRPQYHQEVERAMSHFTELFNQGISFTSPLENHLDHLDRDQTEHSFAIVAPMDLAKANLAISAMLEEVILDAISRNYIGYCCRIQPGDFREIEGITAKKIEEALENCQLIDKDKRLIPGALNPEAVISLEKAIRNSERCKKILEILHCVALRSERKMIRLRLTKSTFLDPRILAKMSQGQLTIEESNLLLTCLGLKENAKNVPICNLQTGEYAQDLVLKLRKANSPSLCFIDPSTMAQDFQPKINWEETIRQTDMLARATRSLAGLAYEQLEVIMKMIDSDFHPQVKQEIIKGSSDHVYLREIFFNPNQLEQFFKDKSSAQNFEAIKKCFEDIRTFLSLRLDLADNLANQLPDYARNMEDCLTVEAETRLQEAIAAKDRLLKKFNDFKHVLRQFLLFTTQTFELEKPHPYTLVWKMNGIEVKEAITLEKSCAVLRRLHFPAFESHDRTDLTYFAEGKEDSVAKRWKTLCEEFYLTDSALAEKLIHLYAKGTLDKDEDPKIKNFLVPLVILLMGKEPSLDRSSLAANFILLMSVKLGVQSFVSALRAMPMIPQGAVSAKQFLLHVSGHSLDAISGVRYKDPKAILPSYFLPTVAAFVGTANDWTEKYQEVARIAIKCCQKLFMPPPRGDSQSLEHLRLQLNALLDRKLQVWEIPQALDYQEIKRKKAEVEKICLHLIDLIKKTDTLPNDATRASQAVKICKKILETPQFQKAQGARLLINQLNDFFGEKYTAAELADELDFTWPDMYIRRKKEIANQYLISMGEKDDIETAVERCQKFLTPGVDSNHAQIQQLKVLLEKIYQIPVPDCDLAQAIEYEGINDNEDEIGKWAIEYVLGFHPLKNY